MGDVTRETPLDQWEAPFIWFFFTSAAVLFPLIPLLWVFQNGERRAAWRGFHHSTLPYLTTYWGSMINIVLYVLFTLLYSISYWIVRGGHHFSHRISVAVPYYASLLIYSMWSVPVIWYSKYMSSAILLLSLAAQITCSVFTMISKPWYAGLIGFIASAILVAIIGLWMFVSAMAQPKQMV